MNWNRDTRDDGGQFVLFFRKKSIGIAPISSLLVSLVRDRTSVRRMSCGVTPVVVWAVGRCYGLLTLSAANLSPMVEG